MRMLIPLLTITYLACWTQWLGPMMQGFIASAFGWAKESLPGYTEYFVLSGSTRLCALVPLVVIGAFCLPRLGRAFKIGRRSGQRWAIGLGGFAVAMLLAISFDSIDTPYQIGLVVIIIGLIHVILIALFEEFLFRLLIFEQMRQRIGTWWAFGLTSVVFWLAHYTTFWFASVGNAMAFFGIATASTLVLTLAYLTSNRSIIPGIGIHSIVDLVILQDPLHSKGLSILGLTVGIMGMSTIGILLGIRLRRMARVAQQFARADALTRATQL